MPIEFVPVTVDDSGTVHGQVSLAVGNANLPTIVYTTTSGAVMLAELSADEWRLSELPGGAAARDEYRVSLALDTRPSADPHVAFASATSDRLIYGVRRTTWQFEEVPTEGGLFPGSVRFPAMKLYPGVFDDARFRDAPHICYQAGLSLRHAAKQKRRDDPDGTPVWKKNVETVDEVDLVEKGWFTALDFDGEDTLRIAYFDDLSPAGHTARRLRLATMTPGSEFPGQPSTWRVDVLDGGDILGEFPALAHSVTGEGAVSYCDRVSGTLKICMFGNFPESPAVEVVAGDLIGVRSSVGVNNQSRWCVVYGSGDRLRFATRTGRGTFAIEDADVGGGWPCLVFDSAGDVHVAHVAGGTLRYAVASRGDD
jgi:hypothetical protein